MTHLMTFYCRGAVLHYNLVSDPGMHSYKECLVSVLWCWEIGEAMQCPWQHLKPGKLVTPLEVEDMDEKMCSKAARHKLERVSAFRQLQDTQTSCR